MSILHTLKRKLRSCRRQQDDVLKTFNEALEQEVQRKLSQLTGEILALAEAKCVWAADLTPAELRAFEKMPDGQKIALINNMFARLHELRIWSLPVARLPIHETEAGFQIWPCELPENDVTQVSPRDACMVSPAEFCCFHGPE